MPRIHLIEGELCDCGSLAIRIKCGEPICSVCDALEKERYQNGKNHLRNKERFKSQQVEEKEEVIEAYWSGY